jgi:hypothetical protein
LALNLFSYLIQHVCQVHLVKFQIGSILVFSNQIEFLTDDELEEVDVAMVRFVFGINTVLSIQLVCLILEEKKVVSVSKSLVDYLSYSKSFV